MRLWVIIGLGAAATALTGLFLANLFIVMMIGEINRRKPDGGQLSYFGHHPMKGMRILQDYRQFYPGGKLHVYAFLTFGLAVAGIVAVLVSLNCVTGVNTAE